MSTITNSQPASSSQASAVSSAVSQATKSAVPEQQALGQDAFLKLLVAQLKNQDPLNPMDNTAFVAQLAQFSQVEQSTKLVKLMEQSISQQQVGNEAGKVSLIGHRVLTNGALAQLGVTGPAAIAYTLTSDATSVAVTVFDATNKPIRTIQLAGQPAGPQLIQWDGRDENGQAMAPGTYGFSVQAKDALGNAVSTTSSSLLTVTGVRMNNGQATLLAGGHELNSSDVVEVY